MAGCCEHGNKYFGSVKGGKVLDHLANCCLVVKDPPWESIINYIFAKADEYQKALYAQKHTAHDSFPFPFRNVIT
jgi:hypothetical protein